MGEVIGLGTDEANTEPPLPGTVGGGDPGGTGRRSHAPIAIFRH
jgi:hypothetical protein